MRGYCLLQSQCKFEIENFIILHCFNNILFRANLQCLSTAFITFSMEENLQSFQLFFSFEKSNLYVNDLSLPSQQQLSFVIWCSSLGSIDLVSNQNKQKWGPEEHAVQEAYSKDIKVQYLITTWKYFVSSITSKMTVFDRPIPTIFDEATSRILNAYYDATTYSRDDETEQSIRQMYYWSRITFYIRTAFAGVTVRLQ